MKFCFGGKSNMWGILNSGVLQFGEMVTSASKELPASIVSLENRGSLLLRKAGTKLHCFTPQKI